MRKEWGSRGGLEHSRKVDGQGFLRCSISIISGRLYVNAASDDIYDTRRLEFLSFIAEKLICKTHMQLEGVSPTNRRYFQIC